MPGSTKAPWATELKARKKSIPRKRSINNGKKGNDNIDDVSLLPGSESADDYNKKSAPLAAGCNTKSEMNKKCIKENDPKSKLNVNSNTVNVHPTLSTFSKSKSKPTNTITTKTTAKQASSDPFISPSNSSSCPCPLSLNSKSLTGDDDKKSEMTDPSVSLPIIEEITAASSIQSHNTLGSKLPFKTGEKDKTTAAKKPNSVEKADKRKIEREIDTINIQVDGNNKSKVNNKDKITKDVSTKTHNGKFQGRKNIETFPENKNIYEEARCQLKPTFNRSASFQRQFSGEIGVTAINELDENEDNPVERLIRQSSIEARKTASSANPKAEAKKREFLVLNYPADVRKKLKCLSSFSFDEHDNAVNPMVINIKAADKITETEVDNIVNKERDKNQGKKKKHHCQNSLITKQKRSLNKGS